MTARLVVWAAIGTWACMGAYASFTDLRTATISRRGCWIAGTVIAGLLAAAAVMRNDPLSWLRALAGAAAVALVLEVIYRCQPDKIGYGDVRLIIVNSVLTAWWGPAWPWWALLAGAVSAWPAAVLCAVRAGSGGQVKWAPWLTAGAAAAIAWNLHASGPAP